MPLSTTRKNSINAQLPPLRLTALALKSAIVTGRPLTRNEAVTAHRAFTLAIQELELCYRDGVEVGTD